MKKIIISIMTILSVLVLIISTNIMVNNIYKNNKVNFSDLSMLCLGDSITYGVDGVNGGRMAEPYPNLLKQELGLKNVYNYGISGSTLCTGTNSFCPMSTRCFDITEEVDIITLMGGINDFSRSLPLGSMGDTSSTTIYGALHTIAECFKSKFPDALVIFISPFPRTYSTDKNSAGYSQNDLCKAVKDVSEANNFPFLDFYNNGNYEFEMYNPDSDGVHPSQSFMKNYTAPQIAKFIKANYSL